MTGIDKHLSRFNLGFPFCILLVLFTVFNPVHSLAKETTSLPTSGRSVSMSIEPYEKYVKRSTKFFKEKECHVKSKSCPFPFSYYDVKYAFKYKDPATGYTENVPAGSVIKVNAKGIMILPLGKSFITLPIPTEQDVVKNGVQTSRPQGTILTESILFKDEVCKAKDGCTANGLMAGTTRRRFEDNDFMVQRGTRDDGKEPSIDKTIAWLKPYLQCEDHDFLVKQKANLIEASKKFGVPAPMLACLIARESKWDIRADQFNSSKGRYTGTFVGLQQANEAAFDTMRGTLSVQPGDLQWKSNRFLAQRNASYGKAWLEYTGQSDFENMTSKYMYVPRGSYSAGGRFQRCEIQNYSDAQLNRIAKRSIGFVAVHLRQIVDKEFQRLVIEGRKEGKPNSEKHAIQMFNSKYSKYINAGAIGYNAGINAVDEYMPDNRPIEDEVNFANYLLKRTSTKKLAEVKQYVGWIDDCVDGQYRADQTKPAGPGNPGIRPPGSGSNLDILEAPYVDPKNPKVYTCSPNGSARKACPANARTSLPSVGRSSTRAKSGPSTKAKSAKSKTTK